MSAEMKESQIVIYKTADGQAKVNVHFRDETAWLTQKLMAELFGVDRSVITKHLKNVFESGELLENSVCAKFAHTANDGKTYQTTCYNLDAIISVGYRVNSRQATQFRIWATQRLREYKPDRFLISGFRGTAGEQRAADEDD